MEPTHFWSTYRFSGSKMMHGRHILWAPSSIWVWKESNMVLNQTYYLIEWLETYFQTLSSNVIYLGIWFGFYFFSLSLPNQCFILSLCNLTFHLWLGLCWPPISTHPCNITILQLRSFFFLFFYLYVKPNKFMFLDPFSLELHVYFLLCVNLYSILCCHYTCRS